MRRVRVEFTVVLLLLAVVIGGGATLIFGSHLSDGIWAGTAAGSLVQLLIFHAMLVPAGPQRIMLAHLSGVLVRFLSVGLMAFLIIPAAGLPEAATLLSMVGCLFLITMIEAVFLKRGHAMAQGADATTIQTEL